MPKTVLITGGTGLIGRALTARLQDAGYEVAILTRRESGRGSLDGRSVRFVHWTAKDAAGWVEEAEGSYGIVNLAGHSLAAGRWSAPVKKRILESRLSAGKAVSEAVRFSGGRPEVVVQASAIGFYGDRDEDELDESSARGRGFLADVTRRWEESTLEIETLGVRRVIIRTALVLSRKAEFIRRISLPFKLFLGGPQGSGRQWMSWIHVRDEAGAIAFLLNRQDLSGVFNLAAPEHVRNGDFYREFGRIMRKPSILRTPSFLLRAAFGEMADEFLLTSQRVIPKRLMDNGFSFSYPDLSSALGEVIGTEGGEGV